MQETSHSPTIGVCLSPALLHLHDVTDKTVVVVDILRATSSMVTAFAYGVQKIMPVSEVEECQTLQSLGYLTAGERNGVKVASFNFGNSPFEYQRDDIRGNSLAMTTTNGTQAIEKAKAARRLVIGSFLNLSATANCLEREKDDVLVVCAGWKGHVNLEDTLFAGALVDRLSSHFQAADDATLAAVVLYQAAQPDLAAFLSRSSHAQRLVRLKGQRDIDYCLQIDQYDVVPQLHEKYLIVS